MLNEIEEYQAVALRPYPEAEYLPDQLWKKRYIALGHSIDNNKSITGISRPMLLVARRFLYETSLYEKETAWQERYLAARHALYVWSGVPGDANTKRNDLPAFSAAGEKELSLLDAWFPNALAVLEKGKAKEHLSEKWEGQRKWYLGYASIPYCDIQRAEKNPSLLPQQMRRIAAKMPKNNQLTFERILAAASDAGPLRNCSLCVEKDFRDALYFVSEKTAVKIYQGTAANSNFKDRADQVFHLIAMILMCGAGDYHDCVSSLEERAGRNPEREKDLTAPYVPILETDFGNWYGNSRVDKYFSRIMQTYWKEGENFRKVFQEKETDSNKKWIRIDPKFQQMFGISLVAADAPMKEGARRYRDEDLYVTLGQKAAPTTVRMGQKKRHRR